MTTAARSAVLRGESVAGGSSSDHGCGQNSDDIHHDIANGGILLGVLKEKHPTDPLPQILSPETKLVLISIAASKMWLK
ncbi:MAG TPA: hypothetical protein VMF12_16365 [Xanthobacteraceae bacterium]|nr:hypothetical protein [Xanthobacteraceae bacterium]